MDVSSAGDGYSVTLTLTTSRRAVASCPESVFPRIIILSFCFNVFHAIPRLVLGSLQVRGAWEDRLVGVLFCQVRGGVELFDHVVEEFATLRLQMSAAYDVYAATLTLTTSHRAVAK